MKNWFTCTCLLVSCALINMFFISPYHTSFPISTELVIVDESLENYETILKELPKGVKVIRVSQSGNGLLDLQDELKKLTGLNRVHLLSHGSAGELILAGKHLRKDNMAEYDNFWQALKGSMVDHKAELLIYSCDLAANQNGESFIKQIAEKLGAAVAASDDPTGSAIKGGNWDLEYVAGSVDHNGVLAPVGYEGLLIPKFSALSGTNSPLQSFAASAQSQLVYGDFDNDGDIDIHSYPGANAISDFWQNQGNGTFVKATNSGSNPFRNLTNKAGFSNREFTFLADFDNDGDVDILATKRGDDKNVFFRNDNGLFVERKGADSPFNGVAITQNTQIIYGDFDNDGDVDLDTWDGTSAANNYYRNNGSGVFTKLTDNTQNPFRSLGYRGGFYLSATYARVADWDNDGDDDIYLVIYNTGDNNVLLRNNNGVFAKESGVNSPFKDIPQRAQQNNQFIYGDFDADGDLDIQATSDNTNFFFYRNNGAGTFSNISGENNPFDMLTYKSPFYNTATQAFVADWDNDGDDDVFTTQLNNNDANVLFIQGGAPPKITSTLPVKNSTGTSVKANIVLNFNNALNAVAGKNIIIKRSDNTTFATIPVNSTQVTGGGSSVITINPTADLDGLTAYYVLIDKGAFVDTDGRPFDGVSASADIFFTTAAAPVAPTVATTSVGTTTTTTAVLGGNITSDGGEAVSERGIVWSTSPEPTTSSFKVQNDSGNSTFSATVSSLPEGTRIYVRAYAINAKGTSYGNQIDFYTRTRLISMVRRDASPDADNLLYDLVFAQSVTGLSADDFKVLVTGKTSGVVSSITGSGSSYVITVTISDGNGSVRLDLMNNAGTVPNVDQYYTGAQISTIYRVSEPSNYFRAVNTTGSWTNAATWESSADQTFWITATAPPTSDATSVQIGSAAVITLASSDRATAGNLTNAGRMLINGLFSVTGTFTNSGTIAGSGSLDGTMLTNNGIIAPGNSPGTLSYFGRVVNNNRLDVELAGTLPGTGHDKLLVSGLLTLGGTLNVALASGYIPTVNNSFTIIDAGSISGRFATVNLPSVAPLIWDVAYDDANGTVILSVIQDPLPVTLVRFDAKRSEESVLLSWQTTSETNSSHFEIERRTDKGWETLGQVPAAIKSNSLQNYNFTDQLPFTGENLYRLKMLDTDGTFAYSRIVALEWNAATIQLSVYPNPSSDMLFISNDSILRSVQIHNLNGILVLTAASVPKTGLDVRRLPAGLYLVSAKDPMGKVEVFRFIKK